MSKIILQPFKKDFEQFISLANDYNAGFEIVELAKVDKLNDTLEYINLENFYKDALVNFNRPISFHGAFIDLRINSPDRLIRLASEKRVKQSLESAKKLNARRIIFHTGYNPSIKSNYYRQKYIEQSAKFWQEMIKEYDIEIILENVFEENPSLLEAIDQEIDSNKFSICFDTGHYNLYSKADISSWIKLLTKGIKQYHFNDNLGDKDSHLAVGKGNFPWQKLNDYITMFTPKVDIVIEVAEPKEVKFSLNYLKKNMLYPFHKYKYQNYDKVFEKTSWY